MAYTPGNLVLTQNQANDDEKQYVDVLFPVIHGASLNNRKDTYSVKFNINTGGDDLYLLVYVSHQDEPIQVGVINTAQLEERFVDISDILGVTKFWQIRLVGLVADFKLTSIALDYADRPEPVSFWREHLKPTGPNKKRIRVWPVILDTMGEDVSIVPYVDGAAQTALVVNSTYPKTFFYQFTTDVFGVDYAMTLHGCCEFELFGILDPVGVQELPIAKRFDQVGSEELFRYGKIKSMFVRVLPIGGTSIPYTIYFEDQTKHTGTITVVDGKEDTYQVVIPKTVAGQVIRIEFGPTNFDFHRFYVTLQVMRSGNETENEWVTLQ